MAGNAPIFLDRLFAGKLQGDRKAVVGDELVRLAVVGGFPEAIGRENERRRQDWARSYLASVLSRDLGDIADIEKLGFPCLPYGAEDVGGREWTLMELARPEGRSSNSLLEILARWSD